MKDDPELARLVREAEARFNALSPAQQEDHRRQQRKSWVRGEMGIGNDADEAAERTAYRSRRHD